jgi:hypothetical protein
VAAGTGKSPFLRAGLLPVCDGGGMAPHKRREELTARRSVSLRPPYGAVRPWQTDTSACVLDKQWIGNTMKKMKYHFTR